MWTSPSSDHTSEHHSPLSSQPYVVVAAVLGLRRTDPQHPPAAALDSDWEPAQPPFLDGASRADRTGAAGQGFAFDAALIGPHPPHAVRVCGNEVDVGTLGRERRVEPQRPAALHEPDIVHVSDHNDEVRDANPHQSGLTFSRSELEARNRSRWVDSCKIELGPPRFC